MIGIIVFLIVFIILAFVIHIVISKQTTNNTVNTSPSRSISSTQIDCGVLSSTTIKKCNPSDVNSICNNCICSAKTNLTGCMVCTAVNQTNPYHVDINQSDCIDPFFWDNGMCKLKDGSYCLPKVVNDITCPSTGRKILVKTPIGYDWSCICKNDTQFTGPTCSNIKLCGMMGAVADTDNPATSGRGLLNDQGVPWSSSSTWDPLVDGHCACRVGEIPNNKNFTCLPNSCRPGLPGTTNTDCDCSQIPGRYINCNTIATVNDPNPLFPSYFSGVCKVPSCIPDPCGGGDGQAGYYDTTHGAATSGKRVCAPGYELFTDPSNIVGQSCRKVCVDNGVCGTRGTCYYYNNSQNRLFTIACSGNTSGTCSLSSSLIYFSNGSANIYLNYSIDSNNNINLRCGPTGGEFLFELECDPANQPSGSSCPPSGTNAFAFQINTQYYLKIGTQYVDLVAGKITSDKTKSLIKFLNTNNPNQLKVPLIYTQIFIVNQNCYLSVDLDNVTISFPRNYSNSERCKDCTTGWVQDSLDLCNKQCILRGGITTDRNEQNCCPGLIPKASYNSFPNYVCD